MIKFIFKKNYTLCLFVLNRWWKNRIIRGFTLIETLIAVSILSSGLILLSNSWSGNIMRVNKAQLAEEVALLLERKMTEIELEYSDDPASIPEELDCDFGDDFKQYHCLIESKDFELPDLSAAMIAEEGGANEMITTMIKTMTDYINKSVKEVRLTLITQLKDKDLKYSLSTYFVNFDTPLALGFGGQPGLTNQGDQGE